ncbi:MAG: AMP-binding protein [Candidatus Rokubacteria bacterium]|nr:AMP-binding protein [Candidatus Rokubacteria bacterium]
MVMTTTATRTLPDLFCQQVRRGGERLAVRFKKYGIWHRVSWRQYGEEVDKVAAALLAFGFHPEENVAVLGENRPEWLYCHLGIMSVGGATCGIYPTSAPEQIRYLLNHSEARLLFLENDEQLDKALAILSETRVQRVVVWDAKGLWGFSDDRVQFLDDFVKQGQMFLEAHPGCLDERRAAIRPDDTAMIIYTSGTTGPPKGAMLSHANILWVTRALLQANALRRDDEVVSYLPFAHIYENLVSVFQAIHLGYVVNFVESLDTLFQNLREISPTYFASVPRIWEKLASTVELRMDDSTWLKRTVYRLAVAIGRRHARALNAGRRAGLPLTLLYRLASWAVLHPLKRRLGFERTRIAVCGAAPASPELFEYYHALGIPLIEGYGQTESSGVISVNMLERPRVGTVGPPIPGIEVALADDGEILTRGPHVFKGYFKDPELTAQTIDGQGWLHTGDIGAWEEGYLKILDRKKDIIITAGGKNIAPAYIENKLKFSPYIQDAVVIGDRKKYLVALLLIDEDNVTKFAQDHRIPFATFADLTQTAEVERLIAGEVQKVNATLSQVESIKKFALLPRRLYEEEGDVTPTKKVKRRHIEERYADLIATLYRG